MRIAELKDLYLTFMGFVNNANFLWKFIFNYL